MTEVYRNHPAVIVKNTASFSVALIIISVSMVSPIPLLLIVPLGLFFAVAWWRTHLTVYEDHAVAESNIISKRSKTIPLGKVASVNEVQGLFGRIFTLPCFACAAFIRSPTALCGALADLVAGRRAEF